MKLRAVLPGEEPDIVNLWLSSFWSSAYAHRWRYPGGKKAYIATHGPRLIRICERADVSVLCDDEAERAILGFAVTEGDVIHYVMAKRSLHEHGVSADAFRLLLGERLSRPCVFSHELCEFRDYRSMLEGLAIPSTWAWDPYSIEDAA